MSTKELLKEIEGQRFASRMNVVSSLKSFIDAIHSDATSRELITKLQKSESDVAAVVRRVEEIVHLDIDVRYENPLDTALAAYVEALHAAGSASTSIAAEAASLAPNCWWANRVSERVLVESPARSKSDAKYIKYLGAGTQPPETIVMPTGQPGIEGPTFGVQSPTGASTTPAAQAPVGASPESRNMFPRELAAEKIGKTNQNKLHSHSAQSHRGKHRVHYASKAHSRGIYGRREQHTTIAISTR